MMGQGEGGGGLNDSCNPVSEMSDTQTESPKRSARYSPSLTCTLNSDLMLRKSGSNPPLLIV
jgi:hypothetical protein